MGYFIHDNLYEYDFSKCFFKLLLSNSECDLVDVDLNNKMERNIKIGLLQKQYPSISTYLLTSIEDFLTMYIHNNNLIEENIIWKQRDGFIIDKKLNEYTLGPYISFRGHIIKLIYTLNKKRILILYNNDTIDVKGVQNKPINLDFYKGFFNINFSNKREMMRDLNLYKKYILYDPDIDVKYFARKIKDSNQYYIPLKSGDHIMKLNKSVLSKVNINDIERTFLWDDYIFPFVESILYENI